MFDDKESTDPFKDGPPVTAAARADAVAMVDHRAANASVRHEQISRSVWRSLRNLGIGGGRMLVIGQDPEIFAGVPAAERRLPPGAAEAFTATIPTNRWPHAGLQLRVFDDSLVRDEHAVVIVVPHYSDVALHQPRWAETRRIAQTLGVVGALANTEPGGFTIALTTRDVLDHPDADGRNLISGLGDLVGAVRLPAGALRKNPGNDASADLLLLRRRHGTSLDSRGFPRATRQRIDGHPVHINQYFLDYPNHLLGRLGTEAGPWGPADLTVRPTGKNLPGDLAEALKSIVEYGRYVGLTARTQHSTDVDNPIGYVPVDLPRRERGRSELDAARARIQKLRTTQQPRGASNGDPGGRGPAQKPRPRDQSGPDGPTP